jgi:hypothetical protein
MKAAEVKVSNPIVSHGQFQASTISLMVQALVLVLVLIQDGLLVLNRLLVSLMLDLSTTVIFCFILVKVILCRLSSTLVNTPIVLD